LNWLGRAHPSEIAGSSLVKPGNDELGCVTSNGKCSRHHEYAFGKGGAVNVRFAPEASEVLLRCRQVPGGDIASGSFDYHQPARAAWPGISRPSALAVCRLTTNSKLLARITGISAVS
jgi:hypothetical protein